MGHGQRDIDPFAIDESAPHRPDCQAVERAAFITPMAPFKHDMEAALQTIVLPAIDASEHLAQLNDVIGCSLSVNS